MLNIVYESLRVIAILLQPATPETASKVLNRLGVPLESRFLDDAEGKGLKMRIKFLELIYTKS